MAQETHALSPLALRTIGLLMAQLNQTASETGADILASMDLKPEEGWRIHFDQRVAYREVPDAPAEAPDAGPTPVE